MADEGAQQYTSDFSSQFDAQEAKEKDSNPSKVSKKSGVASQQVVKADKGNSLFKFNTMKQQNSKKISRDYFNQMRKFKQRVEPIKPKILNLNVVEKGQSGGSGSTINQIQECTNSLKKSAELPGEAIVNIFKQQNESPVGSILDSDPSSEDDTPDIRNKKKMKKALSDSTIQTNRNFNSDKDLMSSFEIRMTNSMQVQLNSFGDRKLKILVANDDAFQLLIITKILKKMNNVAKVDQATNGQEALNHVMESEQTKNYKGYDIIFLDLEMPIMNGYQACSKILEFYKFLDRESNDLAYDLC